MMRKRKRQKLGLGLRGDRDPGGRYFSDRFKVVDMISTALLGKIKQLNLLTVSEIGNESSVKCMSHSHAGLKWDFLGFDDRTKVWDDSVLRLESPSPSPSEGLASDSARLQ